MRRNMINSVHALLILGAMLVPRSAPTSAQVKGVEQVVLFGVDALSPNGIKNSRTPNLDYLIANGAYTLHARAVMPTVSSPNWASMLMGAGPEQHGITSNEWERDNYPFRPLEQGSEGIFPTIFRVLKEQRPAARTTAIYDWDKFRSLIEQKMLEVNIFTDSPYKTITLGCEDLRARKTTLSFLYLGFVDDTGHQYGHGTEEYFAAVEKADSLLGFVLQALRQGGIENSTLLIVSADHGGVARGHGGESLDEIEIPVILYGPGVAKGKEITEAVNNYDIASTIAYALGLKQPASWIGRPIQSAFVPSQGVKTGSRQFVKSPRINPKGGLFAEITSPISLSVATEGAAIFYTVDGSEPTMKSARFTEPFTLSQTSPVKARAFGKNNGQSDITTAYFRIIPSSPANGLTYSYYEGDWVQLPNFDELVPMRTGKAHELSLDSIAHRDDHFAVKFEGYIKIERDGLFKFTTLSDDGSRLYLDEKLVVDNDGSHSASAKSGRAHLTTGMHKIVVTYFDDYAEETLTVFFEGPGVEKQPIPPDVLYFAK